MRAQGEATPRVVRVRRIVARVCGGGGGGEGEERRHRKWWAGRWWSGVSGVEDLGVS